MEPCDIGIALGNALDNAIEAVRDCRQHQKVIEISMGVKKQALVMLIKNPYEHVLKTTEAENINPQNRKRQTWIWIKFHSKNCRKVPGRNSSGSTGFCILPDRCYEFAGKLTAIAVF